jgi:hypothetical protein
MRKSAFLLVAVTLAAGGAALAVPFGIGLSQSIQQCLDNGGGSPPRTLGGDADTVDGFHAYGTPHANALLALNAYAHFPVSVIPDNSIPGSKLAPGAVTAGRLAENSVTTTKIVNGTILGEDVGLPLQMRGSNSGGPIVSAVNDSTASGAKGVFGYSTATSGSVYGVYGQSLSTTGRGVYGVVYAGSGDACGVKGTSYSSDGQGVMGYAGSTQGKAAGVYGYSISNEGNGVYGLASSASGYTYGVHGKSQSSSGRGVYGEATANSGSTRGVFGNASASSSGTGVWGSGGAYGVVGEAPTYGVYGRATAGSGTCYGVYGRTVSAAGYGVYSVGDLYVQGDLVASGSKAGYTTDVVMNGGTEPLSPGDLVEIVSHSEPVIGRIPVAVVRKTDEGLSKAVLGPIDCAVSITPNLDAEEASEPYLPPAPCHVKAADGPIPPGGYGRVVTLGLYERIRVDASYGPIYPGDLLVSSPTPGYAMACDDPKVGTVVGKALGALESGIGEIPVFISPR